MVRKRPCRICHRWFRPHPRAGDRQRTCSAGPCQAERRRRAVAAWRGRHPDYDRDDRLRRRLQVAPGVEAVGADPLARLDWAAARNAVGLEVAVVIEETGRLLATWTRNAVTRQGPAPARESRPLRVSPPRNAIASVGPAP
jgi:hypothetical protein